MLRALGAALNGFFHYYATQHIGGKRRPRRMRWEGAANDFSGIRQALGHELVYVVVVAIVKGVDVVEPTVPARPLAVAIRRHRVPVATWLSGREFRLLGLRRCHGHTLART